MRNFLYNHFRKTGHSVDNISVQPVEHILYKSDTTSSFKSKARFIAELKWIKLLQTPFPLGLNDNIYQTGNISKDPNIDIFPYLLLERGSLDHMGNVKMVTVNVNLV